MTAPNHITERWINYGIAPTAARLCWREAFEALKADGPSASFGIDSVGVFFRHEAPERYVNRSNGVYRRDATTEIRFRPQKVGATLLDESADVRISFDHVGNFGTPWLLKSTSKAGDFNLETPSGRNGETWKFYRGLAEGRTCYWIAHDTLSEAQIVAVDGQYASDSSTLEALRLTYDLEAVWQTSSTETGHFENFHWQAAADDASGLQSIDDVTYGSEVRAHVRFRALKFA